MDPSKMTVVETMLAGLLWPNSLGQVRVNREFPLDRAVEG